jgi:hypothetical protein
VHQNSDPAGEASGKGIKAFSVAGDEDQIMTATGQPIRRRPW